MTRSMLRRRVCYVCVILIALSIACGSLIWHLPNKAMPLFSLSPILLAFPAAYLADCFQRRALFVRSLRSLWSDAVHAKGLLVQHCLSKGKTNYYEAWSALSNVIDEVRGVFRNVGETDRQVGQRPFEPLMDMLGQFEKIRRPEQSDDFDRAQQHITDSWKAFQDAFLEEFDRPAPRHVICGKSNVHRPDSKTKAPVQNL